VGQINAPEHPSLAKIFLHSWYGRALAAVLGLLLWGGLTIWGKGFLPHIDEQSTDWIWQQISRSEPDQRLILVDIDDASINQIGPWPWPRRTMAELIGKLDQQGVGLKLFDVVFPDARDGTTELARALVASENLAPNVLAQVFAINNESQIQSGQLAGAIPGMGCQAPTLLAQGYIANTKDLHSLAGHITPTLDADGTVRRMPATVCYSGRTYAALVLAGLAALSPGTQASPDSSNSISSIPMSIGPGKGLLAAPWQVSLSALPGMPIGLDAQGQMRVPYWLSRSALISVSASDILQGKVAPDLLKGAWVLVGSSAFGLADAVPTALGGAVNGAEVHAQLLLGILDGTVPYTPQGARILQLAFGFLGAMVLWLLAGGHTLGVRQRVLLLPLAGALLGMCAFGLHVLVLLKGGWFVGWSSPALVLVLLGLAFAAAEHKRSMIEKALVYQNLSSYIPASVAEKIALKTPTSNIEALRKDATLIAADLRNFSAYCEARAPEDAARVLHRFYSTANIVVSEHGGVIEEMVGDSLLASFNATLNCSDHSARALEAARSLWLQCSEELPNIQGQGLEPLGVGIGLASGVTLVGSFGPAGRRVHTVMGQAVTVAMRLCDMTTELAYPILVSQSTALQEVSHKGNLLENNQNSSLALKPLGSFLLQGLQQTTKVYTFKNLLQSNSFADQQNLRYLHQVNIAS